MQYKNTLEQYLDGSLFKCETNTATPYIDGAIFHLAVIQLGKKYAEAGFPFYNNLTLEEYGENVIFVVSYSGIVRLSREHIFVLWEFDYAIFSMDTNSLTVKYIDIVIFPYNILGLAKRWSQHSMPVNDSSCATFSYDTNSLTDEFCDTLIRVYGIMLLIEASQELYNSEGWLQNHTTDRYNSVV